MAFLALSYGSVMLDLVVIALLAAVIAELTSRFPVDPAVAEAQEY